MTGFLKSLSREKKWTGPAAAVLGFLEGSFVIFPVEPLAVPMMAARLARAWVISLWMLAGNVLAGLLMYALGALLFEPVIEPLMRYFDVMDEYAQASERLRENAFLALFLVGVTPFPFQVGTAAAGAAGVSLPLFIAAVTISRGIRYLVLAGLVMLVGSRAPGLIERHEKSIFIAGVVLFFVIGAFILWRG